MSLDSIGDRYGVILCDIWGCVHDGVRLYPGALERLSRWREEQRTVILITNAPRTADAVESQLIRLGLQRGQWDGIATSGEAGIAALKTLPRPVGLIGTAADRAIIEGRGVRIAHEGEFDDLACAGLDENRPTVSDYEAQIRPLAERGVVMHCLNPDRMVIRGGKPEPCAGAIADLYTDLGGEVVWYGKPFPAIYRHALELAGNPPRDGVLAIGDGLETDILGAARAGLDAVYVSGGIGQGDDIPSRFFERHGLGDWRPVAVVDGLH